MSLLFEQAGIQKNLKEAGYWYATGSEEELTVLMEREPGLRRDWDEEYGDRMIARIHRQRPRPHRPRFRPRCLPRIPLNY